MAKMKKSARASKTGAQKLARFGDGIFNAPLRMGERADNAFGFTHYRPQAKTFERQELESAYLSSWVVSRSVDAVAEDMTREGVDIVGLPPEEEAALNDELQALGVWQSLSDTIKWARLYGGALGVILIDGDDMETPLDVERVRYESFKGIYPLDRWQVQPSQELVTEFGADFGLPEYYLVTAGGSLVMPGRGAFRIHHTRVIRLIGRSLPWQLSQAQQSWGASILETLYPSVVAYDMATAGMGQLIQKAHLRFYQIEGLRDVLAMGEESDAFKGLTKQFDLIRTMQSIEGLTVGDKEDVFSTQTYSFAGLPDVILSFAQQISGATQIPLVRLLGQSPAGLNSSGESDLRTYYDEIRLKQASMLERPLSVLFEVLYRSVFGRALPDGFSFTFRSLWQMNDEQKAGITSQVTGAVLQALDAGTIDRVTALRELRSLSETTNVFASITDDVLEQAEKEEAELMPPSFDEVEGVENGTVPPSETITAEIPTA